MEIQDFLNISNNKEFLKFPSNDKHKTFLNKKRTATKDPTNATDLDLYEYQDEDLDNIFANAKSFNNINSEKEPNIPTNQNHIEGKTNSISSLNYNKEIELKTIFIRDKENEEIKNKVNTPLKIENNNIFDAKICYLVLYFLSMNFFHGFWHIQLVYNNRLQFLLLLFLIYMHYSMNY